MKLQYLGDSKDSFKWDYHDFLSTELGFGILNIALMMTHSDTSGEGNTDPSCFPAHKNIVSFCEALRRTRQLQKIYDLPKVTKSAYTVLLHRESTFFINKDRKSYFSELTGAQQILLLDPDNGFEPEKSCSKKHVAYTDIQHIFDQMSDDSVVSVFQHFRRIPFTDDYAGISSKIRQRVKNCYVAGICWHSLMFVTISKSKVIMKRVRRLNVKYSKKMPGKLLPL